MAGRRACRRRERAAGGSGRPGAGQHARPWTRACRQGRGGGESRVDLVGEPGRAAAADGGGLRGARPRNRGHAGPAVGGRARGPQADEGGARRHGSGPAGVAPARVGATRRRPGGCAPRRWRRRRARRGRWRAAPSRRRRRCPPPRRRCRPGPPAQRRAQRRRTVAGEGMPRLRLSTDVAACGVPVAHGPVDPRHHGQGRSPRRVGHPHATTRRGRRRRSRQVGPGQPVGGASRLGVRSTPSTTAPARPGTGPRRCRRGPVDAGAGPVEAGRRWWRRREESRGGGGGAARGGDTTTASRVLRRPAPPSCHPLLGTGAPPRAPGRAAISAGGNRLRAVAVATVSCQRAGGLVSRRSSRTTPPVPAHPVDAEHGVEAGGRGAFHGPAGHGRHRLHRLHPQHLGTGPRSRRGHRPVGGTATGRSHRSTTGTTSSPPSTAKRVAPRPWRPGHGGSPPRRAGPPGRPRPTSRPARGCAGRWRRRGPVGRGWAGPAGSPAPGAPGARGSRAPPAARCPRPAPSVHAADHGGEELDQLLLDRVDVDAGDQAPVQLHRGRGAGPEARQPGVARPGVVHGDVHAALSQPAERPAQAPVVVDAVVLGQLEHHAGELAGVGQDPLDGAIEDEVGVEVDGQEAVRREARSGWAGPARARRPRAGRPGPRRRRRRTSGRAGPTAVRPGGPAPRSPRRRPAGGRPRAGRRGRGCRRGRPAPARGPGATGWGRMSGGPAGPSPAPPPRRHQEPSAATSRR